MFTCPYCGRRTTLFGASDIESIAYGRAKCDHCGQDYMIVNDIPMTEKEYDEGRKSQ
jgi:transcription elongation factor Elf1